MHPQPSPPAPATSVQLGSVHGGSVQAPVYDLHDYGDQLIEARRVFWQACAAIFAGALGVLAVILEPVGFHKTIDDCWSYYSTCDYYMAMIGPGVGGGIWCIAQAVWAGFLLFNAKKITTLHTYYGVSGARSPLPRNLLCNASAFTTCTVFTSVGLLACGSLSMFFNGDYGKAVGAILLCMAVATLTASILGCCALCKAGCGCNCCDYPAYAPNGYQQLHSVAAPLIDSAYTSNFSMNSHRAANPQNLCAQSMSTNSGIAGQTQEAAQKCKTETQGLVEVGELDCN